MKTWALMYGIIWLTFLEIMLVLFLPFSYRITLAIHVVIALMIVGFAFTIYRKVRSTSCPERIKRITRTTWALSIFQIVLGIVLAIGIALSWGNFFAAVISFLHIANALAIITQASSSATAFDMWEEKEFQVQSTPA